MVHREGSLQKYVHLWYLFSALSLQHTTMSRAGVVLFTFAKVIRYIFFLSFLLLLQSKTSAIGKYSFWEVILFFTTFNFIDTAVQLFFREVYRFNQKIQKGEFDFYLLQPISPLFRSLLGGSDILDIPLLIVSLLAIIISISNLSQITFFGIMIYLVLVLNGIFIALSFHILILCIGLVSTVMDQILWMYRDITLLGRVPIDVYKEPIRSVVTFIIPVGIMVAFPPQSLLGLLQPMFFFIAILVSVMLFVASILLWRKMLQYYTGAGS